jgi:hypothetical protein
VHFCIPPGWRYRLHQHTSFGGSHIDLTGSGSLDLSKVGFGDEASSGEWIRD